MVGSLVDLHLKQAYHKPEDDVAAAFYLPCLARALHYDRAVGYFSSAIYVLAWPSLKSFVHGGGRIRLICSPVLAAADVEALAEGYSARADDRQGELLKAEFQRLLHGAGTKKPARVLATLVAMGIIDLRIAWVGETAGGKSRRLFHDKLGIFRDSQGNRVAFKGSMNETWPGLSPDGNLESVDVYASWGGERESKRVADEQEYFDRLWDNNYPGVVTVPVPQVAMDTLISAADPEHWNELVDEIVDEIGSSTREEPQAPSSRVLRPHQAAALEAWEAQGRRGILKHATGSGKTFTALCAAKNGFTRGDVVLVLVPSDLLLRQWTTELKAMFDSDGLRLLVCGGGNNDWRTEGRLAAWTRARTGGSPRCVVATLQTACSQEFVGKCAHGPHLFVIADEVHRLGAFEARRVLELNSGARLGLSATPERAGDQEGTRAVFDYFGGIVPPPFSLFDAITAGSLTPYAYQVHQVSLDESEQLAWDKLTVDIGRLVAGTASDTQQSPESALRLKLMLIRRARIVKGARQKIAAAVNIVAETYRPGERWIVYCDDQVQLGAVRDGLRARGCPRVLEYHTAMTGDHSRTLELFQQQGGVIVSIRCLDEGVDIPAVSHALILASSKNPREYVQRRGRVLRISPGKRVSHIHDVLVTPGFHQDDVAQTSIVQGELARAIEFGKHALNPGCITDLERLAIQHGVDWAALVSSGVEDGDEDLKDTE
jgi:superfamily II DNA or RNA helicase